jgi:hypothetical protein
VHTQSFLGLAPFFKFNDERKSLKIWVCADWVQREASPPNEVEKKKQLIILMTAKG